MVCAGPYQRENQAALLTQSLQESPQRWIRATSSNPMQRSCAACPQAAWSWKTKGLRWEWNDHFTLLPASPVSGPHASHMDDQICCFCCCCCCFERRVKKGRVTPIFRIFSVLGDFVLYSTVSLTLVKEQRFIRIIFYYYYFTLFLLTTHPPTLFLGGGGEGGTLIIHMLLIKAGGGGRGGIYSLAAVKM